MTDSLTNIEVLPDIAIPAVQRAFDALRLKRMRQKDCRIELNRELAALGLNPASSSGFDRWAQKVKADKISRPRTLDRSQPVALGDPASTTTISAATATLVLAAADAIRAELGGGQEAGTGRPTRKA